MKKLKAAKKQGIFKGRARIAWKTYASTEELLSAKEAMSSAAPYENRHDSDRLPGIPHT